MTYRNDGPASVTLSVRVDGAVHGHPGHGDGAGGGGESSVTVASDTRVAGPDGYLGGWLVATAGAQAVRTPVGVVKEPESYDLTVRHTGRDGNAPASFRSLIRSVDDRSPVRREWNGSGDADRPSSTGCRSTGTG